MAMMRFCPNCQTERSLHEIFCEGVINGDVCGWDLSSVTISETGWRPQNVITVNDVLPGNPVARCVNGHIMDAGDLICMECGADLANIDSSENTEQISSNQEELVTDSHITTIDNWQLLQLISQTDGVRERYLVKRLKDEKRAVLTLYHAGYEPNIDVYEVLRNLPREHVPEIICKGRWNDQAYVVAEELTGGVLADLGMVINDMDTIRHVLTELGQALNAFTAAGLRHCDLRPNNLLVRTKEPLDLVITGFGSARLSEFDLEVTSPLATTFYTAPEVVAGGVSVASDWWSLGIILLEQLTQGKCFEGINTQAFIIQVLANGIDIPTTLDPRLQLLLRGLLTKDHHQRWQWPEVQAWINGESVETAEIVQPTAQEVDLDKSISLGGKNYHRIKLFALNAANPVNWQEAVELLSRGNLVTWLEQTAYDATNLASIREVMRKQDLTPDMQLMVVLKILNPDIPLILVGDIVTPNWLLQHPSDGYQLITGDIPSILKESEVWLWRLHERANMVRQRALNLQIKLDEEVLKIHLLSASRAQLAAIWSEKSALFPDANNAGLMSLLERRTISEEDLIVLLSAELGQFKSLDTVVKESLSLGKKFNLDMDDNALRTLIVQPRLTLYQQLNERIEGFASTDLDEVDQWVEQYRLEKRMPLTRLLVLLSIGLEKWVKPHKRQYTYQVIDFFHKKATTSILQGPLVRMHLGMYTGRVDINLLGTEITPANKLLDHIVQRNSRQQAIDVAAFQANSLIEYQLNNLYRQSNLYRRDTGIDGLYMGFPFLLYQEPNNYRLPRIAPLLLWPIKLNYDMGVRNRITLAFDNEREEIRVNPALEGMLGKTLYEGWQSVIDELLSRSALTTLEVMDALTALGRVLSQQVQNLPINVDTERGEVCFACSAVLFDVNFLGQSIGEELNRLKKLSPVNTALETALRLKPYQAFAEIPEKPVELDRYFSVASDPSQENAVLQARQESGLLIEGPPGTGKSQTIVNMVGDAIGRNKTVLIVCQKKAALEVVYKRLAAEGLDARSIMINDINADRNTVINSIREQLDLLFKSPKRTDWIEKRKQVAAKITDLENRLDSYHEALHQQDPQIWLSYRELIAELIGINKYYKLFAAPQLRSVVSDCNPQQLLALENECAPIVRFWLPACYENSPLIHLKAFSHDLATLEDFKKFFTYFLTVEQLRIDKLSSRARFEIDNPKPYQQWIETEGNHFLTISESIRSRLVKWLPLFKPNADASAELESDLLINQLTLLQERLALLNESSWCDLSLKLCLLESDVLNDLSDKARLMVMPKPWYSFLSIKRYKTKRSLLAFLALQGELPNLESIPKLYNALVLEQEYRPIRQEIQAICAKLQLPVPDNRTNLNIKNIVSEIVTGLQEVKKWAERIMAAPHCEEVEKSVLQSKVAFEHLLNDYNAAFERYESRKTSLEALLPLVSYFEDTLYGYCKTAIEKNEVSSLLLIEINRVLDTLEAYQYFRKRVPQLSAKAIKLFERLRFYQEDLNCLPVTELDKSFRQLLNYEAKQTWKTRIEQDNPVLLTNADEIQQQIESLATADEEIRELNNILFRHNIPVDKLASAREWEDITRLTGQRARRLREFVEQGEPLGLMSLRPIWLMNPDIVSRLLPLKAGLFDVVIFDEASQMPVEYAIPSLYRGKLAIVSGDEKQMPPSSFFSAQVELEEDLDLNLNTELTNEEQQEVLQGQWNSKEIMDCPDLLQLARSVLPTTSLQIHYRSAYRELIDFSNAAFYMNQLNIPVRHPLNTIKQAQPIEYRWANGVYEQQTNPKEANTVVQVVSEIWQQSSSKRPSIGVVTFNKKQADLIEKIFYEKAAQDKTFATIYKEENQRVDNGEDMSIFIKNVENVQGDERDIIVFSTTFGCNEKGIFRRNFGVLGQQGGERRLNVAITRARKKVVLVSSMPIGDISDMLSGKQIPTTPRDYLQCYLAYAKALSEGDFEYSKDLLNRVVGNSQFVIERAETKRQDAFLDDVEAFIQSMGVGYKRQSGNGVFALDFAIEDPATKLYSIGIECDAPINPLLTHARSREIWRQSVLRHAIPNILRISSHNWYENKEQEKKRLKTLVETVLTQEVSQ